MPARALSKFVSVLNKLAREDDDKDLAQRALKLWLERMLSLHLYH